MLQYRDEVLCSRHKTRRPSHFFNSFFMTKLLFESKGFNYREVRRWTKSFDPFAMDKIFFPINHDSHWTAAVIFVTLRQIRYYDSLSYPPEAPPENGHIVCSALLRWLKYEAEKRNMIDLNESEWTIATDHRLSVPQQSNHIDCGVFTTMCIDFLSDDLPLQYSQGDMENFRIKIAQDILRGELMD